MSLLEYVEHFVRLTVVDEFFHNCLVEIIEELPLNLNSWKRQI